MLALPSATVAFAVALLGAVQVPAIERYEGLAYEKKSGRLLYLESHWVQQGRRLVLYRCPNGQPFARKHVAGDSAAPDFDFIDGRDGYREGVRTQAGNRQVYARRSAHAAETHKPVPTASNQLIDAGFDAYVRQQWDRLSSKEAQHVKFLVPSRLQSMDFKLVPLASAAGQKRFSLSLDAWYGAVLPDMTVTYSSDGRRLARFEGIGNIRTNAGKYPTVRIEFPADRRKAATAADFDTADRTSLVQSCGAP